MLCPNILDAGNPDVSGRSASSAEMGWRQETPQRVGVQMQQCPAENPRCSQEAFPPLVTWERDQASRAEQWGINKAPSCSALCVEPKPGR